MMRRGLCMVLALVFLASLAVPVAAEESALDLNELNKFLRLFTDLGVSGLFGAFVIYLLLKHFLPKYVAKTAENLADKNDIAEITRKVESVKGEFAIQLQELQHQKTLLQEGFKNTLSKQQEFERSVNAAVVDLTKQLAAGSHIISWLSWNATQPGYSFSAKDFRSYDRDMLAAVSELVGSQASVAALDASKFRALSPFAEELYDRDVDVAKAKAMILTVNSPNVAQGIKALQEIYTASLAFDKRLLDRVQGLLQQ